jgi:hypothetical protein
MTESDTGTELKQPGKQPAETQPDQTAPDSTSDAPPESGPPESGPPESGPPEPGPSESGTGAGQSDAPRIVIGAQESSAINANLAGLAAGTVRLAP